MQKTTPSQWISPGELGIALGVSTSTVRRYEEAGKIPQAEVTLGGHRRWRRSQVQHILEGKRSQQQKAGA